MKLFEDDKTKVVEVIKGSWRYTYKKPTVELAIALHNLDMNTIIVNDKTGYGCTIRDLEHKKKA